MWPMSDNIIDIKSYNLRRNKKRERNEEKEI